MVKTIRPMMKVRFRPNRSPVEPHSIRRLGYHHRVGSDGPLQSRDPGVQAERDRWECDVHDSNVESYDEEAQTGDEQHYDALVATKLAVGCWPHARCHAAASGFSVHHDTPSQQYSYGYIIMYP